MAAHMRGVGKIIIINKNKIKRINQAKQRAYQCSYLQTKLIPAF